jgi:PiT family inorganic phosphate transporter
VAATIAGGIIDAGAITSTVVLGGLIGAIAWKLTTWCFGLPSSSSHALIGGIVGATVAAAGTSAVQFGGIVSNVIVPAVAAPLVAGLAAVVYAIIAGKLSLRARRQSRSGRRRRGRSARPSRRRAQRARQW